MRFNALTIAVILGLISGKVSASDSLKTRSIYINPEFHQIKEAANYGLVNQGLNIDFGFKQIQKNSNYLKAFNSELAFGINYAKGLGMNWTLTPVDLHFAKKIESLKGFLGAYTSFNYHFQLYPELQSGHLFWFTNHEMGLRYSTTLHIKDKPYSVQVSSSLLGFTSRPKLSLEHETLFYDLSFKNIVKSQHSNLKLGLPHKFSHLNLEIQQIKEEKKWTLGYEADFIWIGGNSHLKYLTHSINLNRRLRS
ncbi:MAG: hypothetical protein JXR19_09450 [Bacteroidia bacterium]